MPRIVEERSFDGAKLRIRRLGLDQLVAEARSVLTGFELPVPQANDGDRSGAFRRILDSEFTRVGGWAPSEGPGVDWVKSQAVGARPRYICIGVTIPVSDGPSMRDDLRHLRAQLLQGHVDVAVLVVPSDKLSLHVTDRVVRWSEATRHIHAARADDMPFILMAIEHDGAGPPLPKKRYKSKT